MDSVLYAHKVNPSLWQNLDQVEQFGFLSTMSGSLSMALINSLRNSGSAISLGDSRQ